MVTIHKDSIPHLFDDSERGPHELILEANDPHKPWYNSDVTLDMALLTVSSDALADLNWLDDTRRWGVKDILPAPETDSFSHRMAIIRGEAEYDCPCDRNPVRTAHPVFHHLPTGAELAIDGLSMADLEPHLSKHLTCIRRRRYTHPKDLPQWSSARHDPHRVLSLKPRTHSALEVRVQEQCIARLPDIADAIASGKQRGWVLLGETGYSKSTWVTSVLQDVATAFGCERSGDDNQDSQIMRVRVGHWLDQLHSYNTRDFRDSVCKPTVTIEAIEKLGRRRMKAVLWLEELDRFPMTESRGHALFRLIDTVYEMNGTIIVTANANVDDIRAKFDPALVRRLFGDVEDASEYTLWNLHAAQAKTKPKPKKAG